MANMSLEMLSIILAAVIVGIAVVCAVAGNVIVIRQFIVGLSRQPEAKDALLSSTLICVGLIEALPIIGTVVALILLFANPLLGK